MSDLKLGQPWNPKQSSCDKSNVNNVLSFSVQLSPSCLPYASWPVFIISLLLLFGAQSFIYGHRKVRQSSGLVDVSSQATTGRDAGGRFLGSQLGNFILGQKAGSLVFLEELDPKPQDSLQVFFLCSECYWL